MGEYAMFNGERVKIGTDRDMHSLRYLLRLRNGHAERSEESASKQY